MKKCPYCTGEIPDQAKKCRYCGEWVSKEDESHKDSHYEVDPHYRVETPYKKVGVSNKVGPSKKVERKKIDNIPGLIVMIAFFVVVLIGIIIGFSFE